MNERNLMKAVLKRPISLRMCADVELEDYEKVIPIKPV
jgi:hypothetical protein